MTKFKKWLIENFLPIYIRQQYDAENKRLQNKLNEALKENERLRAYIAGYEEGSKKIIKIYNNYGGDKK